MEWMALAEVGPVGFLLVAVLLTLKVAFDYFNTKKQNEELSKELKSVTKEVNGVKEVQTETLKVVKQLHRWHDSEDADGVKIWYRRNSFDERMISAIDKLANAIDGLTELQREHSFKLTEIENKLEGKRDAS